MSEIDHVKDAAKNYFYDECADNYVRILDTPNVWGQSFDIGIMPRAKQRTEQFKLAVKEIIQKSQYRCDISSLNSPDPDWTKVILEAMDTTLTCHRGRTRPTQFRFLFGQTPMYPILPPDNYTDFKAALIRLLRVRGHYWEMMPEIWFGRFYRLQKGISAGILKKFVSDSIIDMGDTKMTWNHSKIIASDGAESLVGGHNLNMDLFTSYPPVHDVSVVTHGPAALGAQLYLNKMWECKTNLLTKEYLDVKQLQWFNGDDDRSCNRKPADPLESPEGKIYVQIAQSTLIQLHKFGIPADHSLSSEDLDVHKRNRALTPNERIQAVFEQGKVLISAEKIRADDLKSIVEAKMNLYTERDICLEYDNMQDYKRATRILSIGKYWTGAIRETDYQKGSEIMKEQLIKGAKHSIKMSQMDLISAWKKNWSDHVVCHWLMDALRANSGLTVQVVVSPLDAGAGAGGDQYSFGSGAKRTYELFEYYFTHEVMTDTVIEDLNGSIKNALSRLHIAPFYFTNVPNNKTTEGTTYKWPGLTPEGYTATLQQPPLLEKAPKSGKIGSAAWAVVNASSMIYKKVESAPGNHAKIMIIDDNCYVVGSDNLYPGFLSEFNYLVEGENAINELLNIYWNPLWNYSSKHCVNPSCRGGCIS